MGPAGVGNSSKQAIHDDLHTELRELVSADSELLSQTGSWDKFI